MSDLGGDPACWLERVCDDCGGMIAADEPHECRHPASAHDQRDAASSADRIASGE